MAVPAVAVAAMAADADVFAAGRAVEAAWRRLGETCEILAPAERAVWEWEKLNPKPQQPEGDSRCAGETAEQFLQRLFRTRNDGPSVEWQEYEKAKEAWEGRRKAAEHEYGKIAADALQEEAGEMVFDATERLCAAQATTMEGLHCKARVAVFTEEHANADKPIAWSIVEDLMEMQS
jgi:hypothetical protein